MISGEIEFTEKDPAIVGAILYVRLLNVSRMDAPSIVVSETRTALSEDSVRSGRAAFQLDIDPAALKPRETYTLSAFVDISGNGIREKGDFITMESYPFDPLNVKFTYKLAVKKI